MLDSPATTAGMDIAGRNVTRADEDAAYGHAPPADLGEPCYAPIRSKMLRVMRSTNMSRP